MLRLEDKGTRLKDPAILGCDNCIQGTGVASFPPQGAFRPSAALILVFLTQRQQRPTSMHSSPHLLPHLPLLPFHLWKLQTKNLLFSDCEGREIGDSVICGMPLVTELTLSQAPLVS